MRKLGDLQVARRRATGALVSDDLVGDLLPFVELAEPRALNGADVDEYVLAAVIRLDETKAFRCVEPFDGSRSHRCGPVDQVAWSGRISPVRYRCGRLPRRAARRDVESSVGHRCRLG